MKLWGFLGKCKTKPITPKDESLGLQKLDKSLHEVEKKLADDKAALSPLPKAVASARRVKYHVDSFTDAMYDGIRRGHG